MRRHGCGKIRRLLAGGIALMSVTPAYAAPPPDFTAARSSGGQIAFASTRGDGDAEIFVMDADGSNVRQITHNRSNDHSPDWAPDGRRIVFVHDLPRQENSDLHIVDTVTGEERVFTSWRYWYETGHAWSPDGEWIAFSSEHPDGDGGDVIALSVDGERSRPVATQQENSTDVDPARSPDGKRLVLIEYYDSYDLYTTSFCCNNGYRRRTVTRDALREWLPEWSPDGQTIVFYAKAGVGYDIYRIDVDGTGLARLTDHTGSDQHPAWSPVAPR